MKKVIKLTEADLARIVRRVIKEQSVQQSNPRAVQSTPQSSETGMSILGDNSRLNKFLDWYGSNLQTALTTFKNTYVPSSNPDRVKDESYLPPLVNELLKLGLKYPNAQKDFSILTGNTVLSTTPPEGGKLTLNQYLTDYIIKQNKGKLFFDKVGEIFRNQYNKVATS